MGDNLNIRHGSAKGKMRCGGRSWLKPEGNRGGRTIFCAETGAAGHCLKSSHGKRIRKDEGRPGERGRRRGDLVVRSEGTGGLNYVVAGEATG